MAMLLLLQLMLQAARNLFLVEPKSCAARNPRRLDQQCLLIVSHVKDLVQLMPSQLFMSARGDRNFVVYSQDVIIL